jgi:type VI secretion system protein ImpL
VRALNALRTLPGGYRDQKRGTGPGHGAGLSQADKLGTQALRAYRNALRDALFPRLNLALESELKDAIRSGRGDRVGPALEAYLDLHQGAKANPRTVGAAVLRAWSLPDADSAAFLAHMRTGLEEVGSEMHQVPDEAIIREARQKMAVSKKS